MSHDAKPILRKKTMIRYTARDPLRPSARPKNLPLPPPPPLLPPSFPSPPPFPRSSLLPIPPREARTRSRDRTAGAGAGAGVDPTAAPGGRFSSTLAIPAELARRIARSAAVGKSSDEDEAAEIPPPAATPMLARLVELVKPRRFGMTAPPGEAEKPVQPSVQPCASADDLPRCKPTSGAEKGERPKEDDDSSGVPTSSAEVGDRQNGSVVSSRPTPTSVSTVTIPLTGSGSER